MELSAGWRDALRIEREILFFLPLDRARPLLFLSLPLRGSLSLFLVFSPPRISRFGRALARLLKMRRGGELRADAERVPPPLSLALARAPSSPCSSLFTLRAIKANISIQTQKGRF